MTITQEFLALDGKEIKRTKLTQLIEKAKQANHTEVVYRLSKIVLENPEDTTFEIAITKYPTALAAPHHRGAYKEALTKTGKLRKGWRFVKGRIVKSAEIPNPTKKAGLKSNGHLQKGFKYAKGGKIVKVGAKKKE